MSRNYHEIIPEEISSGQIFKLNKNLEVKFCHKIIMK